MCAAAQVGHAVPRSTLLIGVESEEGDDGGKTPTAVQGTCAEVADPMALLDTWVSTLREAQRRPLPFFQNAGAAWLDSAKKGKPVDHLDVARKKFEPAFKTVGDLDDPYVALCFPEEDPLAVHHEAFERLARTLAPTLELPSVG
jgi:exonuclease V gamma subunit